MVRPGALRDYLFGLGAIELKALGHVRQLHDACNFCREPVDDGPRHAWRPVFRYAERLVFGNRDEPVSLSCFIAMPSCEDFQRELSLSS